jgi:hypothetical protein
VLFSVIFGVLILFLIAWVYVIFGRPSVFYDAAGLSLSCSGVFVIRIFAVVRGEENLVRMISW